MVILKESVAHFRQFFSVYLGYSAWILIPTVGVVILDLLPKNGPIGITELASVLLIILGIVAVLWISIVMIHLAAKLESTEALDTQAIETQSVKQILPLLWVAVVQGLLYLGGLLLLVIPLFLFVVWYCFAQVSVVLDGKHGMEALSWSKSLVKGRFWKTAMAVIGIPAFIGLCYAVVVGGTITLILLATGQSLDLFLSATKEPVWVTAIDTIGQLFLIPITSIYSTKVYLAFKEEPLKPVDKEITVS